MGESARRGRFITIEGGEGVGKSLLAANLAQGLRDFGVAVTLTREPGGTPTADKMRALFAAPAPGDPLLMPAEALLVSAARAQHVGRLIRPAIARGDWVLCDRFADSTRVYQGALGGLDRDALEALIRFSVGETTPDLTLLLDCDVSVARRRRAGRGGSVPGGVKSDVNAGDAVERYDDQDRAFHERLRQAYLALAAREPGRIVTLDADRPPDALAGEALQIVEARCGAR